LYLFRYVFPINGQYTAVGNDFILLYYKYKVYLLACLADFHFPLWSPAEGAGYPFYTNPFAQAFYPFNLWLVVWYKISGGVQSPGPSGFYSSRHFDIRPWPFHVAASG